MHGSAGHRSESGIGRSGWSPVNKDGPPRVVDAFRRGRGVWLTILVACLLTAMWFSEAFLLLKSQEAGFSLTWVPITLVMMHAVYGLTAYPVGRLSDAIGRTGLLATSLVFLVAAYMVLAYASSICLCLRGGHRPMGAAHGLLGGPARDADRRQRTHRPTRHRVRRLQPADGRHCPSWERRCRAHVGRPRFLRHLHHGCRALGGGGGRVRTDYRSAVAACFRKRPEADLSRFSIACPQSTLTGPSCD